ncbi:glycosyltransferase family 4 protein [Deinococcus fonticola]|uniref:glycosyltransferase family 4 protein n=1 Tax=Deinococcus fonticola TaxID=2528713 RepID=UPI0010750F9D|nr:glycosyltransferase family 4 protein [Deinococcus fonticola]
MKILALSPYPLAGPSSRYRIFQFVEPLRQRGIHLDVRSFLTSQAFQLRTLGRPNHPLVLARVAVASLDRLLQARSVKTKYDAIFISRQTAPFAQRFFDAGFIRSGVPIVFDMDDAVFTGYPIDHLLRASAAVTVGNAYLADYVRKVAPGVPVYVIPTVVDTAHYAVRPPPQPGERPVVGWIGTASTFRRYLLPFLPGLLQVCQQFGAEFRVIASPDVQAEVEAAGATFVRWSLSSEVEELQRFNVGVMPLLDDAYVRGKCAFKLIEYGAVGIPGLGSDIGANREVIEDGLNGFLGRDASELEERLRQVLDLPDLGRGLGLRGRQRVEERFSLHSQVATLAAVFQAVRQGRG